MAGNPSARGVRQSRRLQRAEPENGKIRGTEWPPPDDDLTWKLQGSEQLIPPPADPPFAGFGVENPQAASELSRVRVSAYSDRTALLYERIFTAPEVSTHLNSMRGKTAALAFLPEDYEQGGPDEIDFEDATVELKGNLNMHWCFPNDVDPDIKIFQRQATKRVYKYAFFLSISHRNNVRVNGCKLRALPEVQEVVVGPLRRFTVLEIRREPFFIWISPNPPTVASKISITQPDQAQEKYWKRKSSKPTDRNRRKRGVDVDADDAVLTSKGSTKRRRLDQNGCNDTNASTRGNTKNTTGSGLDEVDGATLDDTRGNSSPPHGASPSEKSGPTPQGTPKRTAPSRVDCKDFREKLLKYKLRHQQNVRLLPERIELGDQNQTNYPRILNLALASVTEAIGKPPGRTSSLVDLTEYKDIMEHSGASFKQTRNLLQVKWHYKDVNRETAPTHADGLDVKGFYYLFAYQSNGSNHPRIIHKFQHTSESFYNSAQTASNHVVKLLKQNWAVPDFIPHLTPSTPDVVGILPVLNGWAMALGAALERIPSNRTLDGSFFNEAVDMINLAIAGCMHSDMIVSFFDCYGYLDPVDLEQVTQLERFRTIQMDTIEEWKNHLKGAGTTRPLTKSEHCIRYSQLAQPAKGKQILSRLVNGLPNLGTTVSNEEKYLDSEIISLAIASVSEAQTDKPWCIAPDTSVQMARVENAEYRVTRPRKTFILPWVETSNEGNVLDTQRGSTGNHWILIVASMDSDASPEMIVFDSLPTHLQNRHTTIAKDVQNALKMLSWNADPDNSSADLTDLHWKDGSLRPIASPTQYGVWACGFHTILNAWAYMLNLELKYPWEHQNYQSFYEQAKLLIQYVGSGLIGSDGIHSFLACHDYILQGEIISEDMHFEKGAILPSNLIAHLQEEKDTEKTIKRSMQNF